MLGADQAEDLRRLLGTVEDWLLHTCYEVRDDLGGFLVGLGWSGAGPRTAGHLADQRPRRAHHHPAPGHGPHRRPNGIAMNELISTRIHEHAVRLTLPNLAENLDGLLTRAQADTMGYLEFVDLLLGEEVGLREGRRFRAALKLSGLPHHKGLDAFDFAFQPDLDTRKVRDLTALEFVAAHDDIALLGPPVIHGS